MPGTDSCTSVLLLLPSGWEKAARGAEVLELVGRPGAEACWGDITLVAFPWTSSTSSEVLW